MTRQRVPFRWWGLRPDALAGRMPTYAMAEPYEDRAEVVARSIARACGLVVVNCCSQGTALDRGQPSAHHYQITLGRRIPRRRGGGFSVEGSMWIAIPLR